MQLLNLPEDLSIRKRKDLDGYSGKIAGEKITSIPAILIGQIAKNDLCKKSFDGSTLMEDCLNTILEGQKYLAGRLIMLECKEIPELIDFYKKFDFIKLEKNYDDDELLQFYRIFKNDELI